jgi:hypothetical protein
MLRVTLCDKEVKRSSTKVLFVTFAVINLNPGMWVAIGFCLPQGKRNLFLRVLRFFQESAPSQIFCHSSKITLSLIQFWGNRSNPFLPPRFDIFIR